MMRVLAVVPYPHDQAPSQRYRIEQLMPALGVAGIDVELAPFVDAQEYGLIYQRGLLQKANVLLHATTRRMQRVRDLESYDAVLVHREAALFGPALFEVMAAARKPVVFDFDDAIWLRNSNPGTRAAALLKFPGKTSRIVRHATAVMAGNSYLADWARQFNANTHVVPTTIDTIARYGEQRRHAATDLPILGWTGSASTLRYLATLKPVLEVLATQRQYRLRVIYDGPPQHWPGIDIEWRRWSSANEVRDLLDLDIGLMPQPDEEWARGKCGFKALQYMALGIPAVASGNGVLPEIIQDNINGCLASNADAWLTRLNRLIDDWQLRATMGAAARATVTERYSTHVHAPRVAQLLRSACNGNPKSA